jgi:hypothetical protein
MPCNYGKRAMDEALQLRFLQNLDQRLPKLIFLLLLLRLCRRVTPVESCTASPTGTRAVGIT